MARDRNAQNRKQKIHFAEWGTPFGKKLPCGKKFTDETNSASDPAVVTCPGCKPKK